MTKTSSIQKLFDRANANGHAEFAVQANSMPATPTTEAYAVWQRAFRFFNERLFRGALCDCIVTLTRSVRARGYFCPGSFQDRDGKAAHEISMNPTWFEACGDPAALSIFVHEMCHLWRHDLGPLNRKGGRGAGGYHDAVWADRMEALGLMPSNTGEPGGRRLGFQMTHYMIEGGPFARACREFLADGNFIDWRDGRKGRPPSPIIVGAASPSAKNTRTRFVCPSCEIPVWARRNARLACEDCRQSLVTR